MRIERAKDGDLLFREGDTDHQHIYLLEGRVVLLSGTREVDAVQSGAKTARFALAHQWPRKFSARAVGEVRFIRIESRMINDLLVRTQSQSYRVSDLDGEADGDWMTQVLRSRMLQQTPPSNIQNVLRRMEEVDIPAGTAVIRQGEEGDCCYIIVRGAGVVTRGDGGSDQQVALLGPGDSFGEEALVTGGVRCATVSMASDSVLMRLNKGDFAELIRRPLLRSVKIEAARVLVEQGAGWIDIRSPEDYTASHPPGAMNLPLGTLRERHIDCALEGTYVVYGGLVSDSAVGTFLLREQGFDVWALEGGFTDLEARPSGDNDQTAPEAAVVTPTEPTAQRVQELEQKLRETQSRYHKVLLQRMGEIRQLRQMLEAATADRQRLEQAREEDAAARGGAKESEGQMPLEQRIAELQQELDDAQEILQDASAQESSAHWERLRIQAKLESTAQALAEQREINRVLQEENEETMRRLEVMQQELSRLDAKH